MHRDGAMCEQVVVPVQNLLPADGLSLVEAATVEFLAVGAHAVRRSMALGGNRALVIGAGPIGLGTALFAQIAKQDVTIMDVSAERLAFAARQFGFLAIDASKGQILEKISERTMGAGFDVVYDATGNSRSMQSAFAYVAHGGVMVMVSVVQEDITFSDPEFHKREMMLIGSRNATRSRLSARHQVDPRREDTGRPTCHSSHDAARRPARHRALGSPEVRPDQGNDRRPGFGVTMNASHAMTSSNCKPTNLPICTRSFPYRS